MEKNKKRCFRVCSIFTLLFVFLAILIGCSSESNTDEMKDSTVSLFATGVDIVSTIDVTVVNENTGEIQEIKLKRNDGYKVDTSMDYGVYSIKELKSNNSRYKLKSATESFTISSTREVVEIVMTETNVSGTFSWFLRNNAFLLSALAASVIAYGVVKIRKKKMLESKSGKE